MVGATITQIAGTLLLCIMIFFIFKNYVKSYIESSIPYKNILLFTFCIILFLGSIFITALGLDWKYLVLRLIKEKNVLTDSSIAKLEHQIFIFQRAIIILGAFVSIIFIWFCYLYYSVKKEIKEFMSNYKSRWDLDKIK